MDIQLIIAIGFGLVAISYIVFRFIRQLKVVEKDPKCDDCHVIDIGLKKK